MASSEDPDTTFSPDQATAMLKPTTLGTWPVSVRVLDGCLSTTVEVGSTKGVVEDSSPCFLSWLLGLVPGHVNPSNHNGGSGS